MCKIDQVFMSQSCQNSLLLLFFNVTQGFLNASSYCLSVINNWGGGGGGGGGGGKEKWFLCRELIYCALFSHSPKDDSFRKQHGKRSGFFYDKPNGLVDQNYCYFQIFVHGAIERSEHHLTLYHTIMTSNDLVKETF